MKVSFVVEFGTPIDVLWFVVSRRTDNGEQTWDASSVCRLYVQVTGHPGFVAHLQMPRCSISLETI